MELRVIIVFLSEQLAAVPHPSFQLRLPALPVGWQAIQYAVLADGTLAVIATGVDLEVEHQRIRAAHLASSLYDHTRLQALAAGGTARVWLAGSSGWTDALSFQLEAPFPLFDRFEDGRWLVLDGSSREDANARVLAPDGTIICRFKLGDGVSHIGVDGSNRIWVGWTDEGMYGNGDWNLPGRNWAPCDNGLACFAADGTVLPLPEWPDGAGDVIQCYALNVSGQGAFTCPYTEFPLVHFVPGKPVQWWRNTLSGPSAIALDETHALIAGGDADNANRLTLVALNKAGQGEHVCQLANWALPLRRLPPSVNEGARVWYPPDLLAGRGDRLHLVDDGVWQWWRVADLANN